MSEIDDEWRRGFEENKLLLGNLIIKVAHKLRASDFDEARVLNYYAERIAKARSQNEEG